ncbi:hypothetical protein VOLCADRAFT_91114 [Volvox carteri f. nagariensis]|uniref:DUF155 domain-containing protein n=1 Tax=Volvox carteri f. nagariensis TaxID=3068 RepID=D8TW78_VOLCA|nr:uncharacterized protein VOLCADRAFT_91114 [Volvox carteri f. nagariensis]EFJ48325.1 hypothetical protein VOLCADRAFT_91114 [Volvox carteri f. nagariensis]|eukprot:XP_002950579.1 hypothetical protein VOLCADRAFT_91114 [Volvox carteri f. nagariensis]
MLCCAVLCYAMLGCAGILDNNSIASMDWNDWMMSESSASSSSSDGGEGATTLLGGGNDGDGSGSGDGGPAAAATAAAEALATSSPTSPHGGLDTGVAITIRIAFYAVAAAFDRRQLETRLRAVYGSQAVRKYPDVIHCQLGRGREDQPGTDVFFFDYGVVACWGLSPEVERDLVQNVAVQCAVQPLSERDQERDVFRCTFATNPSNGVHQQTEVKHGKGGGTAVTAAAAAADAAAATQLAEELKAAAAAASPASSSAAATPAGTDALGSVLDVDFGSSTTNVTTSNRRYTRRAERSGGATAAVGGAIAVVPPQPSVEPQTQVAPAAVLGPYSVLSFPPKIADDTVLLHVRHCGDIATLLAVSYALAQSTKLSAFEKAVEAMVKETQGLPEALAEHGEVHLSGKEIGRLIGKVFVLKRSVNLLGSVAETPEFFWYAPDQLQEMLELLRAQEENRHGNRLELVVIWLIVVEVVLGFFELLELFGVIGPKHGF